MAKYERLYNFANGTKTDAEQVDAEFNAVAAAISATDDDLQGYKPQVSEEISRAVANATGSKLTETGTSFPVNPSEGQTFYHKTNDKYYIYSSGQWVVPKDNVPTIVKEELEPVHKQLANINLQMEVSKRIVGADAIGTTGLDETAFGVSFKRKNAKATTALSIGSNVFTVDSTTDLAINEEYTIFDDVNFEHIKFNAIDTGTKACTLASGLTKAYKANAMIAKTNTLKSPFDVINYGVWEGAGATYSAISQTFSQISSSNSSGVLLENGDMYFLRRVLSGGLNDAYLRLSKIVNNVVTDAGDAIPFATSIDNCGILDLGAPYVGIYYWYNEFLHFRIVDVITQRYVETVITDGLTGYTNVLSCVSPDKKTVHLRIGIDYMKLTIKPNMTVSWEIEPAVLGSQTSACFYINKGYLVYAWNSGVNLLMIYRSLTAKYGDTWTYNASVITHSYTMESFHIMVDSNDVAWLAFGDVTSDLTYYSYATSSIIAFQTPASVGTGQPTNPMYARWAETKDQMHLFFGTSGSGAQWPVYTQSFYKSTKALVNAATSNTGISTVAYLSSFNTGSRIISGSPPFIVYDNTNYTVKTLGTYNVEETWVNVLNNVIRFSLADVKELSLYVYTTHSNVTVKGFVDGVEMDKLVNGTETTLDMVFTEKKASVEVRLEITRPSASGFANLDGYRGLVKIIGGKSDN